MRTYDFAPLYRSTVGFDRMFSLLDQAEASAAWPPYNIEKVSGTSTASPWRWPASRRKRSN